MYHNISPRSTFETKVIGNFRRIHLKDGNSTLIDIESILYDVEGFPALVICKNAVIKWDEIKYITFVGANDEE